MLEASRIVYPESDGLPMTESDWHYAALAAIRFALDTRFADREDVYVASNLFVYYTEGVPADCVSPDVFVCLGVPKRMRKVYKTWEEGKGPDVVFEITSASSRMTDQGLKRAIYASLGVSEFYVFDPLAEYLPSQLRAFRRVGEDLSPVTGPPCVSPLLGLRLEVVAGQLHLYDAESGRRYHSPQEIERAREESERARLESERARLEAEARVRALEEEVRRLRGET